MAGLGVVLNVNSFVIYMWVTCDFAVIFLLYFFLKSTFLLYFS